MNLRYNPIAIEETLRSCEPLPPFPPITDRTQWEAVGTRLGTAVVKGLIEQAEADAQSAIPPLPASLWLDFARTGRRDRYEGPAGQRRRMLWNLTVAECLQNQGRFCEPLLDLAWATCEESSWAYPAHQADLADMTRPYLDLGVAGTALMLAEMDALVGSVLEPQLHKRIADEVDRRCLTPYLNRHDHWWLFQGEQRNAVNWTAVCNSGIVGAALYLETDPARLAAIIARATRSLDDYIASFDPDGGTSEGPGYWGYGFGNYVILADLLWRRTDGAIDLMAGERLGQIARFPLRTLLSHGTYVNFADCDPDVAVEPALLHYLGERLALPDLHGLAFTQPDTAPHRAYFDWGLRNLFWLPPNAAPTTYAPARHDWFRGLQWVFVRNAPADPNGLVLAAKGGHNNEMHNQNDIGNFIVHWRGESLIADLGRGKYTKEYFGATRYEYLVNSSLGHSVPVVNGQAQGTGEMYAAQVLERESSDAKDTLLLDLTKVYPATAHLTSLQRRLTLHRDASHGWVSVEDRFAFAEGSGSFESVLITFNEVALGENGVLINGIHGQLRVGFDPTVVEPRMEEHTVEFDHGVMTVRRMLFAVQMPVQVGTVRLEVIPVDKG